MKNIIIGLVVIFMTISQANQNIEIATFAGGCFWCIESAYEKYLCIKDVVSGYTGGEKPNPTYKEVSSHKTNHYEAVQIHFNPSIITYEDLLEIFWRQIDPTDAGGSFIDRGKQYASAIFYHNEEQKLLAKKSKKDISKKFSKPIATRVIKFKKFYNAEEYHQDYYKKNPIKYKYYRFNSGRDQFRKKTWENDMDYKIMNKKTMLTPLQYKVTQENGTEPPFNNKYWDNTKKGIYVDIISGEPLFSSTDKFKSGTGWPSFSKPLVRENIIEKKDFSNFMIRTEVKSKKGNSHLGHIFKDGPEPTGLRYCINSAALRFIPKENLEKEGYGRYFEIFQINN